MQNLTKQCYGFGVLMFFIRKCWKILHEYSKYLASHVLYSHMLSKHVGMNIHIILFFTHPYIRTRYVGLHLAFVNVLPTHLGHDNRGMTGIIVVNHNII